MNHIIKPGLRILPIVLLALTNAQIFAQNNTQIRGFVDVSATYSNDKVSFGLGEQDLFITSDLNDRLSFLGETVFKFDPESETQFSVSIERIILKYNYKGNHNILIGKHHTPINYWNDTYHHGRVFFPTVGRPLIFSSELFPLHTTGISFQGLNLGPLRFGYDLMIGNGIGSTDVLDLDKGKSVTAAIHIKPRDALRIGLSYYYDRIPGGIELHSHTGGPPSISSRLDEQLVTLSVANFGEKLELLAESTLALTNSDSTGKQQSFFSYAYLGYKLTDKVTPYVRVDHLSYSDHEHDHEHGGVESVGNTIAYQAGLRYQINYLATAKIEFQNRRTGQQPSVNMITTQFAIGF
ncbi:hypothetical protein [Persicitalea jodogahamensis]|uniref:Porin n=1 Tax=Persicitalea jodogahamensis TaxID=402147 RepID=A0A8J3G9W8_9BACT|nr:hypothetical protein [Persicitalea jodogahamensis]GHB67639.1 hypothetical protein GCM10007390_21180 [Persicitalea jodogahamensis]